MERLSVTRRLGLSCILFNCQILVAQINVMLCYRDIVICTACVNLNLDVKTIQFSLHLIGRIDDFTSEKVCLFTWLCNPRDYAVLPWTLVLSLSCCFNVTAQPMKLRLVILYEFVASQCRMNIHYANSRSRSDWLRQPLVSISM